MTILKLKQQRHPILSYLTHFKVSMCGRGVEAGAAGGVLDLEELRGPGEEEAHHPHVPGEAGQVQGRVARGGARALDINIGLVENRSDNIL